MSPKDDSRCPFVFVLQQNFDSQLAAGRLVYAKNPEGLADRLKPIFFIGIGRAYLITGPYKLTGKVEYCPNEKPPVASRMTEVNPVYGLWQELKVSCPYQVTFKPLVPIEYGIRWNEKVCPIFGLNMNDWEHLIQVSLTNEQINKLAEELTKLNSKAQ